MNLFDIFESNEQELDENLRKWFKEKWVRFGPDGKIRGDCARNDDSEGKPKCLPQAKAHALGKKGRKTAASRKRREDPNPERSGPAINVKTKESQQGVAEGLSKQAKAKKEAESVKAAIARLEQELKDPNPHIDKDDIRRRLETEKRRLELYRDVLDEQGVAEERQQCPECGGPAYSDRMLAEKQDACYHKVKSRYKVWPSAYASGALVQCRKKGASNWGTKSEGVAEGYYDLPNQGNIPGMEPIDFSSKPSFKDLITRYTQLVYQGHAGEISPEEDQEYDDIENYVAQRFGEKGSAHLQKAGQVSYWGRDDKPYGRDSRSSNLGRPNQPSGDFRTTKAGKMHGQDAKTMKSKVTDRLGRHPAPNLPEQSVAEAGPFSYGKAPRKGSVADLAAKKRREQEQGKQPIEPKDQQVGVAKVTKGVAEAGPFSYGSKKPRRGSVAANAEQRRREQERGKQPVEPRDQRVGTAKVTKGVTEAFGPLPRDNQQIQLGRYTVSIERVGINKNYIGFAWHDSKGQEHYEEVPVGDLGSYDDLKDKILDEIRYQERKIAGQGMAEGLDPEKRQRLKDLIDDYKLSMKERAFWEADAILDKIKHEYGKAIADKVDNEGVAEGSEDKTAQQRKTERDKQRTAPAQKARNQAQRKGLKQDKDGTYYAKEGVAEGEGKTQKYEMMMRNGQVKKFVAKDDSDAKRIAAGHGAKSVIKLRGGVPAGKVSEQGVAEGQKLDRLMRKYVPGSAKRQIDDKIKDQQFTQLIARDGDPTDPLNQRDIHQTQRNIRRLNRVGQQGVAEQELDEACWKGYHKEGNKKMFGKTVPNCVKNTNEEQELDEKWSQQYKDSINCSNPKGFSQKAHCDGKNKNESKEYYNVVGTSPATLRKEFNMSKDPNGWYLSESASRKDKIEAFRAFGAPKKV